MAPQDPGPVPWTRRLPGAVALGSVLVVAGLLAWHSLTDLDIWFHLRAGRDLLAGGGFPRVNTYSFAYPDHPWLNHEWLFQAQAVLLGPRAEGSVLGWNLWRLALVVGLVVLLAAGDGTLRSPRQAGGTDAVWRAGVLLAGLALMWPRFNLRPELFSYLAFVLLVRWADRHFRGPAPARPWRARSLWQPFALVMVWAQLHGFAAVAPLVLLFAALLRLVDRRDAGRGTWPAGALFPPLLVALVALVLTPNLWHGLLFPLRALGQFRGTGADLTGTVSELVPLLRTPNSLAGTLLVFRVSLVWGLVFAVLAGRGLSPLRLILCGLAAVAALANQRNIGLYGVAFVLLHGGLSGPWPAEAWRRRLRIRHVPAVPAAAGRSLFAAAVVALGVWWSLGIIDNGFYLAEGVGRRFGGGRTPAIYPAAAAAALERDGPDRTFANLDAAAFLLGTTDARLFIDGRTEAYPATAWEDYRQLRDAGPAALSLLSRQRADAVVLALQGGAFDGLARDLLGSPVWRVSAADGAGLLFLPARGDGEPTDARLLATAAARLLDGSERDPTRRADNALAAARLFDLGGNPGEARRALDLGLDARPDHPQLNHNLGNRLLAAGEFAAARRRFASALAVNRRLAGSALNLGVCALRQGDTEAAITAFRRAVDIDPRQVGGWLNLAVALDRAGDRRRAVAALEKAAALRPADTRLQNRLRAWRQSP